MQKFPIELSKSYDPKAVDPKWYQFWLDLSIFKANVDSQKPPFCIVMPPPNVTGVLHMGHALVNTLQDVLIRWKRMQGFETLFLPGTDHAGIATQTVVERHLLKTTGKRRVEFLREDFLAHTWKWKEENEHNILNQLKKLGCSCDFSRLRFTMDEGNNRAVRVMFKKLYSEGLIYRGEYLVNWDPVTETALADDEVEYEEKNGFIYTFRYPLQDSQDSILIATTRPETMLGDTAIAVSPKDPRYLHLIGKNAIQPLTGRALPIIADPFVDPEFGTGAVKITPAHDPNDYKMGLTYKLPFINIMTPNGKVNEEGGKFAGLTFQEARDAVIQEMKKLGHFEKMEPHINRVGVSYRSKALIEPYLSKQWFVKMSGFAEKLKELVSSKKVKLVPENFENTYFHWIDNLRDWCISRQLWWGHQIPIWYHVEDPTRILCSDEPGTPKEVLENPSEWVQDEDVLDTWFSSALWPFSTLGWPEKTPELARFYPNSTLITGHDILFFWVARMIAMGDYALEKPPFPETFLHGLIYGKSYYKSSSTGSVTYVSQEDRLAYDMGKQTPPDVQYKWEKMSKSKGNVIDPLEIIDEYGTDAMRMTLCASATQSREIDLDRRRFEDFRNFTNKIWNGARFVLMNLSSDLDLLQELDLALEDRWILAKLSQVNETVNQKLANYQFDGAALSAYDFFWKEFCAYYVEIAKPYLFGKKGTPAQKNTKQKVLLIVLCQAIRLLHPMAPFITEELFQELKKLIPEGLNPADPLTKECLEALACTSISVSPFPKALSFDVGNAENEFHTIEEVVYLIRNLRGEMKLAPGVSTDLIILGSQEDKTLQLIQKEAAILESLVKIKSIEFVQEKPPLDHASEATYGQITVLIPLPKELIGLEKERLAKEAEKIKIQVAKLQEQLANPQFLERAPPELIAKLKTQLDQGQRELEKTKVDN